MHTAGEKGIGFKSVFVWTDEPHVLSNGYDFKFKHAVCMHACVRALSLVLVLVGIPRPPWLRARAGSPA